MTKTTIAISYSDLRAAYSEVISFTEKEYWQFDDSVTSKSSINFDLGIDGDDASEFLTKFQAKFMVSFKGFDFYKYFGDEGVGPINFLLGVLLVVVVIIQLFLMIFFPKINRKYERYCQNHSDITALTIGDLVASALHGNFIERNAVTFVIHRPVNTIQ